MTSFYCVKPFTICATISFVALLQTASAAVNTRPNQPQQDSVVHWTGTQTVGVEKELPQQTSNRIWVLETQADWSKFCKNVQWHKDKVSPAQSVDFRSEVIAIFKNVKYVNRMSLAGASYKKEDKILTARIRETRTARPIVSEYYFVAVVIPKGTKSITDGVVRWIDK